LLLIYWPFMAVAIWLSGATGESPMIWPPVFGILLGLIIYSLIAGVVLIRYKKEKTL